MPDRMVGNKGFESMFIHVIDAKVCPVASLSSCVSLHPIGLSAVDPSTYYILSNLLIHNICAV